MIDKGKNMAKAKAELGVTELAGPGVVSSVEELLSGVAGVEYAHVNLGAGKVTIHYEDTVTGVETLIAALKGAGFDALQQ